MWTEETKSSRPVTPSEDDCCYNACNPCIFDVHQRLLAEYMKKKKGVIDKLYKRNVLCLSSYTSFSVVEIKEACEQYILLSLKYEENDLRCNRKIFMDPGQHVILRLYHTAKAFTPIAFTDDTIQFLIRLYPLGKFSTCLKNIRIGEKICIRGPYGNFKYEYNSFHTIIMFSMGSGIAAVYPVAKSITENELEETKVHLIAGFHNISQIPLQKELQLLTDYWNFKCTLHISQLQSDTFNLHGINIRSGRLNKQSISDVLEDKATCTTLILICGTAEFNHFVKQSIKDMNFEHLHVFE